ncbi:uncharacterized protein LOC123710692 isoform X1 [Pieris brassicae]|uniref:uncharacterized protein LOC123710692 isoform X1 n=1 Tax=Pieris brassicae TaxID=7116 RepID=UPI001E65F2C2|nr:uncharacterized protein LOC123710692 isoform X1 [Pieris brassicae]
MLKLLVYLCLFGLSLNAVSVLSAVDYDYGDYYGDESKQIPFSDKEPEKPTIHKIKPLDENEDIFNDVELFKNNNEFDNEAQYDSIGDYQIEDNRSEEDMKDIAEPLNKDQIKSTKEKDQLYNDGFEEDIKNYLHNTKQETSNKDILDETKAILKEDSDNNFADVPVKNPKDNIENIVAETTKLLEETDNNFDENTKLTKETITKVPNTTNNTFNDIKKYLSELDYVRSNLKEDFDTELNADTNLGYDLSEEKADDQDYQEIGDDDLDRIFSEETEEKVYDDERSRHDYPEGHQDEQIYYSNDALSALDSTPSETTVSEVTEREIIDSSNVGSSLSTQLNAATIPYAETELITTQSVDHTKVLNFKENKSELPEFNELDSDDQSKFNEKYQAERAAHSEATNTVQIHLTVNDNTIVSSPNYPNFYPANQITDYVITGVGQGIEMNITDFAVNSFIGDYVLIIPGETEEKGSDGILISYSLRKERRFQFTDVDRMFIRFEAKDGMQFQRGFNISLRNIMSRPDMVSLPDPEEDKIYFTSNATITVNLGGVSMNGFISKEEDFRRIVADMATLYINTKGIDSGLNTTLEVTRILSRRLCFHNWPGSDLCTEIVFSVPLVYDNETLETRFTKQDLRDMWDSYSGIDPFAVRLERMGIREFSYPDNETTLTVWLVIAAGVIISMAMLAFALWRFSCFEEYTKMPAFSDTDSLRDEKRVLDLYPTPHQTLPPLYSDDNIKWADDVYSNKDVGFSNKSYMQDIYDMDSDDEALRAPDRNHSGAISPRDIYNV